MQKVVLSSQDRKERGKGPARQMRMRGQIPAALHRKGVSTMLELNKKEIDRILVASGKNTLITLETKDAPSESRLAILKEVQRDPVTGNVLHVDFIEILMTEPITLRVRAEIVGVAVGVKTGGGSLQHGLRDLEIKCLPSVIPESVRIDITHLNIGDAIHVSDIPAIEGIEVTSDAHLVVVSVIAPISDAKMEAMLAGTPKDTKAPEVVGAKEKEEAAAAKADDKGKGKDDKGKGKDDKAKKEGGKK
ncbi:MAG: 50S ribosomal protein L25 [Nitrospirota bacterium]